MWHGRPAQPLCLRWVWIHWIGTVLVALHSFQPALQSGLVLMSKCTYIHRAHVSFFVRYQLLSFTIHQRSVCDSLVENKSKNWKTHTHLSEDDNSFNHFKIHVQWNSSLFETKHTQFFQHFLLKPFIIAAGLLWTIIKYISLFLTTDFKAKQYWIQQLWYFCKWISK